MLKIKECEEVLLKKKDNVWFAIFVNFFVLLILIVLFQPIYETNDDMAMSNIVDGSWGKYSPNLVFESRFIGFILSWLYQTFNVVPWYAVLQYVVLFGSFVAITNVVLHKIDSIYQMLACLAFLFVFAFESFIRIQFTKTAAVATAAGVLILLGYLSEQYKSKLKLVLGYFLAFIGSMYRIEQFFLEIFLLSGIGVIILFSGQGKERIKIIGKALILFFTLLVIVIGGYLLDRSGYKDGEWKTYMKYNSVRCELYDYVFPSYSQFKDEYQRMNIDENTFWFYRLWNHFDDEKFSVDMMEKLISMREKSVSDRNLLADFFKTVPKGILHIPCFYVVISVFVFWLFSGGHRKADYLGIIYEILIVGMVYFYLYYQGRYLKNRVDVGIWLAFALIMLWGHWEKRKRIRRVGAILAIGCFFVGVSVYKPAFRFNAQSGGDATLQYRQMLTETFSNKEHLYLNKVFAVDVRHLYGPFERIPEGTFENVVSLGGWTVKMPMQNELLRKYDIKNPLRDIVDREDVFIVDTNINLTLSYIRKWYCKEAEAKLIKTIGSYGVYQIQKMQ